MCACAAHTHSDARSGDEGDDRGSDPLRSRRRGPGGGYGAAERVWGCEYTSEGVSSVVSLNLCMAVVVVSRRGDIESGLFQGTEELEVRIMVQARPGQDIR